MQATLGAKQKRLCNSEAQELWLWHVSVERMLSPGAADNFWEIEATTRYGICSYVTHKGGACPLKIGAGPDFLGSAPIFTLICQLL